jgi:hypothetical protein
MNLSIGILIIGSLHWDDQDHRRQWRNDRLQTDREFPVRAPIRYGRKSESRGNTYTMIFSPSCDLGKAKAVLCKKRISSIDDLMIEAEKLWIAERRAGDEIVRNEKLSTRWGCVALLQHPRFLTGSSKEFMQPLIEGWKQRVSMEPHYNGGEYEAKDGSAVNKSGLLQIGWPALSDGCGHTPLDLILATVTKPSLDKQTKRIRHRANDSRSMESSWAPLRRLLLEQSKKWNTNIPRRCACRAAG